MTSIVYGPFFLTVRIVVISFDFIFFIGLQVIHKIVIFDFFKPLSSSKLFVLSQIVNDDGYRLYLLIISLNIVDTEKLWEDLMTL